MYCTNVPMYVRTYVRTYSVHSIVFIIIHPTAPSLVMCCEQYTTSHLIRSPQQSSPSSCELGHADPLLGAVVEHGDTTCRGGSGHIGWRTHIHRDTYTVRTCTYVCIWNHGMNSAGHTHVHMYACNAVEIQFTTTKKQRPYHQNCHQYHGKNNIIMV